MLGKKAADFGTVILIIVVAILVMWILKRIL